MFGFFFFVACFVFDETIVDVLRQCEETLARVMERVDVDSVEQEPGSANGRKLHSLPAGGL